MTGCEDERIDLKERDWPAWLEERGWKRSPVLGHDDLEFWKLDSEANVVYNTPGAVMHQRSIERAGSEDAV